MADADNIDTTDDDAVDTDVEETDLESGDEDGEGVDDGDTDAGDDIAGKDEEPFDKARAMAALSKKNKEAEKLRAENKRLKALEAELTAIKRSQMSDQERLQAELEDAKSGGTGVLTELNQLKVQKAFPQIDDELLELIGTGDLDDMMARAEKLAAKLAAPAAKPPVKPKPPAKNLKGGSNPDDDPLNVDAVVGKIRRWA